jgi:hypothetical protein
MSQPNVNMYRPGSVTSPTYAQVTLLTVNHFPFAWSQTLHVTAVNSSLDGGSDLCELPK